MSVIRVIAILLAGFVLSWMATHSIRNDSLYRSVHDIGYRFSEIVPSGKDTGELGFDAQYVRIEPAMFYDKPPALSEPLPLETEPLARFKTGRDEHLFIPAAGMMIVVLALMSVFAIRSGQREILSRDDELRLTKLAGVFAVIATVHIGGLMLFRLFLTGVDDGLIARASTVGDSGNVFHYAQKTLSMSFTSLMMLYSGAGLATYLLLVWIGLRMVPDTQEQPVNQVDSAKRKASVKFGKPLRYAGYAALISINLVLVLAPWTNTMWALFLG